MYKRIITRFLIFSLIAGASLYVERTERLHSPYTILKHYSSFEKEKDGYSVRFLRRYGLTFDGSIQSYLEKRMSHYKTGYIDVIMVDVKKKKMIAFYDRGGVFNKSLKAASIFKVFTLIAGLSSDSIGPFDPVEYRGNPHSSNPEYWTNGRRRIKSLSDAFGESSNPAFALLGEGVGEENIIETCRNLLLGTNIMDVVSGYINESTDVRLLAPGLKGSYISPLYASILASGIANDGVFFIPEIVSGTGYISLGRLIDHDVAAWTRHISMGTVIDGTARRYYKRLKIKIEMGGKTGSITGIDPPGWYEWFVGWAPVDTPLVAVVVFAVHDSVKYFSPAEVGLYMMNRYLKK